MRAYCYNRNVSGVVEGGKTPYEHRFGEPFPGTCRPFVCRVEYLPESERETKKVQKCGSKLRPGIFMGHHSHNGGKWSGDYYVVDAEAFIGAPETQRAYVHRVKEILEDSKVVSPSKMVPCCRLILLNVHVIRKRAILVCNRIRGPWIAWPRT